MIPLMILLGLPDISGVPGVLAGTGAGFPVHENFFLIPFSREGVTGEEPFFRAGFTLGETRSFHCRGNGFTAGTLFHTAGWFSGERWVYLLGSPGLFTFTAAEDPASRRAVLGLGGERLFLGAFGDSTQIRPGALWETRGVTAAAGPRGAGAGFAPEILPGLHIGPGLTPDGPWIKGRIRTGPLLLWSSPAVTPDGSVAGKVSGTLRGASWLLAGSSLGDSLVFAGIWSPWPRVSAGIAGPEWGGAVRLGHRALSLLGSAREDGERSCGIGIDLPWGRIRAWGVRRDGWEWGLGLELGKGRKVEPDLHPPG